MPTQADVAVTVILTTYNHEAFIRQAVESVLIQETRFPVEVVILDDCSTDRTPEIIGSCQREYPERIRLMQSDANRCDNAQFMEAVGQCRSPYIAVLDGDDYWTSTAKLQRQIDYLETHPDCSVCFHNVRIVHEDGAQEPSNSQPPDQKTVATIDDLLEACFVINCSAVVRSSALGPFPDGYVTETCPDWLLFIMAARHGTVHYLDEIMSVYRQHPGGYWSGRSREEHMRRVIGFYARLSRYLPDMYQEQIRTLQARQWYELSWANAERGAHQEAWRCLVACVQTEADFRRVRWSLRTAGGNVARLIFPVDARDTIRIDIVSVRSPVVFDIQLNQMHVPVTIDSKYVLRFRAKADRPRGIHVGVAMGEEPWHNLGLYWPLRLTPEWQSFETTFTPTADEHNGRIHFDLGSDESGIDIAAVTLDAVPRHDGA